MSDLIVPSNTDSGSAFMPPFAHTSISSWQASQRAAIPSHSSGEGSGCSWGIWLVGHRRYVIRLYPRATKSLRGDHIRSQPDARGRKISPGVSSPAGFTGFTGGALGSPLIEILLSAGCKFGWCTAAFAAMAFAAMAFAAVEVMIAAQPLLDFRPIAPACRARFGRRERRLLLPHRHFDAADLLRQPQLADDLDLGEVGGGHANILRNSKRDVIAHVFVDRSAGHVVDRLAGRRRDHCVLGRLHDDALKALRQFIERTHVPQIVVEPQEHLMVRRRIHRHALHEFAHGGYVGEDAIAVFLVSNGQQTALADDVADAEAARRTGEILVREG